MHCTSVINYKHLLLLSFWHWNCC